MFVPTRDVTSDAWSSLTPSLPPAFETLVDSLPETRAENFRENLSVPPGILHSFQCNNVYFKSAANSLRQGFPQLVTSFSIPLPGFKRAGKGDCESKIKLNKQKGKCLLHTIKIM